MTGLTTKIHYSGNESDVYTVEEISAASLAMLIGIANTSKVNLTYTALLQPLYYLVVVVLTQSPEVSEVVHQTVGYHTKCHPFTIIAVGLHHTIYCIIESRVTANNHYRTIAVVYHHLYETIYTCRTLALHKIVLYAVRLQTCLNLLPTTFRASKHFMLWAIEYAPTVIVYHNRFVLFIIRRDQPSLFTFYSFMSDIIASTFSSIDWAASIQWIV